LAKKNFIFYKRYNIIQLQTDIPATIGNTKMRKIFEDDKIRFLEILKKFNLTPKMIAKLMEVKFSKVYFWTGGYVKFTQSQEALLLLKLKQYYIDSLETLNKVLSSL